MIDSGPVWLNVASSTGMLEGFINLDNHILLSMLRVPREMRGLLPKRHKALVDQYEELARKYTFVRHDCRKPLPFDDGTVDHILCSHFLEHVFPSEAEKIISDFGRALKTGGTLHIVVPDLLRMARRYVEGANKGSSTAADEFINETLLGRWEHGSLIFRVLEFLGGYGLSHRWMYDEHSISERVVRLGFSLGKFDEMPSAGFRKNDGSVHVVARKGQP